LAPAGSAAEFYATTLHYAPCDGKRAAGFRAAVVLPRGTNTEKPGIAEGNSEDRLLFARNKWLIALPGTSEAAAGAFAGLTGGNIDIKDSIYEEDLMKKYSIGVDFGTLSGRALLVDAATGEEVAESTLDYPHGVMDEQLPDGTPLGTDWALQHPADYLAVFEKTVPGVLKKAGVSPEQVIGLGVDFTACTVLPVTKDGTPLCFLDEFRSEPNAYIKLWKHHAAQKYANALNAAAEKTISKSLLTSR
jgi:hypothetical protein